VAPESPVPAEGVGIATEVGRRGKVPCGLDLFVVPAEEVREGGGDGEVGDEDGQDEGAGEVGEALLRELLIIDGIVG
jgi:hypothetical protein